MLLAITSLLGAAVATARAETPAQPAHTWALSAGATADTAYEPTSGSRSGLAVTVGGQVERDQRRSALPDAGTGGALWMTAGGDAPGLGGTHWARLRAQRVELLDDELHFSFSPFELRHQLDWHVRPALASRRGLWRRPYTREGVGLSAGLLGFGTSTWQASVFGMGFDFAHVRQRDGALTATQNEYAMAFACVEVHATRAHAPPFHLALFAAETRGTQSPGWASVGNIDFLRLRGVRIADTFVDLAVGMAGTHVLRMGPTEAPESGGPPPSARPAGDLPLASTTALRGRVHGRRGSVSAALSAHRDAYLTFESEPALEHRVSGELAWTGRTHGASVQAFAAHTEVWTVPTTGSEPSAESDITGGLSGSWQRHLDHGWDLDLSVDIARSFYASLHGDARPSAELGARATAQLSRSLGGAF